MEAVLDHHQLLLPVAADQPDYVEVRGQGGQHGDLVTDALVTRRPHSLVVHRLQGDKAVLGVLGEVDLGKGLGAWG